MVPTFSIEFSILMLVWYVVTFSLTTLCNYFYVVWKEMCDVCWKTCYFIFRSLENVRVYYKAIIKPVKRFVKPVEAVRRKLYFSGIRIYNGKYRLCEISSSHGGEYDVQSCLLGCTACKMIVDRRFRGAYCLHHQGSSLKRRSTIILHGSTTQKTALNKI
jgi:hypothetical protein